MICSSVWLSTYGSGKAVSGILARGFFFRNSAMMSNKSCLVQSPFRTKTPSIGIASRLRCSIHRMAGYDGVSPKTFCRECVSRSGFEIPLKFSRSLVVLETEVHYHLPMAGTWRCEANRLRCGLEAAIRGPQSYRCSADSGPRGFEEDRRTSCMCPPSRTLRGTTFATALGLACQPKL